MAFVKGFDINGINTIQTACIELQAPPNAATEGAVGLLAIDMSSPTKDVYKCVAVNGAIYTWELLSSGMSILNSSESGEGSATATFTYSDLRMTVSYVVKVGDLILDSKGYLYRITKLNSTNCTAEYCNVYLNRDGVGITSVEQEVISNASGTINRITIKLTNGNVHSFDVKNGQTAYELAVAKGYKGTEEEWLDNLGYDSWLKGMVVTEEIYNSLPDEEKNKPGFMYVIKDAEIQVDSADEAKRLNPALVMDNVYYSWYDEDMEKSLPDGLYVISVRYSMDVDVGIKYLTTGLLRLHASTSDTLQCNHYFSDINTMYFCELQYWANKKWGFKLKKMGRGSDGSNSLENRIYGYITLYRIG